MNDDQITLNRRNHWFWGSIFQNKATYVQIALASIFINLFGLGSAFYIMTVYDRVMPNSAYSSLIALTIGMGIVITFDFIIKILRARFIDIAGSKLEQKINDNVFKKILSHDSEFLSKTRGVSSIIREFEGVRDFFTSASMVAFIDLPFMFLFLGVIYMIAGPLAVVPILIVPIVLGVSALTQPILKKYSDQNLATQQGKMTILHELLNNVETVRTVAGGRFLHDRWNSSVEEQSKASIIARGISNFAVTFSQTGLQISQAAIVCYGVVLVGSLDITAGALIACVILSGRILSPLVQAGQLLTKMNHAFSAYSKLDSIMKIKTRDEETENYKATNISSGEIEVKNISYKIEDKQILDNINMSILDGEKIGIVGNIGSGKTTLIRSIIGYHLPSNGIINLGGYDIKNIPAEEFRKYVGYCPQKIQLFTGSVYENITAGFEEASEDDVIEAATLSCAHDFIAKLPGGYNYTLIENGSNLSGGQRQAIALARSFIRKPKLLILDEPTSSMDANTEQTIVNNIMNLNFKPTILISTHRTNHLLRTDKICVLVDGKMAAFGPTKDIIKENKNTS
tara:strand:- start:7968 stop:9674 length:1707 start_codon:yes stop_codon:yes gene_type:complete